jgi:hypothetical protein
VLGIVPRVARLSNVARTGREFDAPKKTKELERLATQMSPSANHPIRMPRNRIRPYNRITMVSKYKGFLYSMEAKGRGSPQPLNMMTDRKMNVIHLLVMTLNFFK